MCQCGPGTSFAMAWSRGCARNWLAPSWIAAPGNKRSWLPATCWSQGRRRSCQGRMAAPNIRNGILSFARGFCGAKLHLWLTGSQSNDWQTRHPLPLCFSGCHSCVHAQPPRQSPSGVTWSQGEHLQTSTKAAPSQLEQVGFPRPWRSLRPSSLSSLALPVLPTRSPKLSNLTRSPDQLCQQKQQYSWWMRNNKNPT